MEKGSRVRRCRGIGYLVLGSCNLEGHGAIREIRKKRRTSRFRNGDGEFSFLNLIRKSVFNFLLYYYMTMCFKITFNTFVMTVYRQLFCSALHPVSRAGREVLLEHSMSLRTKSLDNIWATSQQPLWWFSSNWFIIKIVILVGNWHVLIAYCECSLNHKTSVIVMQINSQAFTSRMEEKNKQHFNKLISKTSSKLYSYNKIMMVFWSICMYKHRASPYMQTQSFFWISLFKKKTFN